MTTDEKTKSTTVAGVPSSMPAIVIAVAIVVYAVALCVNPGPENDLFWQLRTGQTIMSTHAIPHFDTYSWTRRGTPWVAHEWLTFVLFWIAYAWKGFAGVWLLTAAVAAVMVALLYALILRETSRATASGGPGAPATAMVLTAFASTAAGAFFQPRPQIFTYLFTLVTLAIIMRIRRAGPTPLQWLVVPLFILWANLHAGVLVGVAQFALFAIGDAVIEWRGNGKTHWRLIAALTGTCFLATLATPYSYHEYQNILSTVTNSTAMNNVAEWASPNYHNTFGKLFEGYVLLLLAGLFLTRLRHDPVELIVCAVFLHEALTESRNVPLLALTATVLMARHLQSALVRILNGDRLPIEDGLPRLPADSLFGSSPSMIITAAMFAAICFAGLMRVETTIKNSAPQTGPTLDRIALASISYGDHPSRAAAFIERENIPATIRMYNSYDEGGFLIWRMPEHPVFVDSRADVYFGPTFDEVRDVTIGVIGWRTLMDKNGVDMIFSPVSDPQSRGYLEAPDWALVYVDHPDIDKPRSGYDTNNTFIFIRRVPQYTGLIARCRRDCPALARMNGYSGYLSLR